MSINVIETDGTPRGTRVLDGNGEVLPRVHKVERRGSRVYVTTREHGVRVEGIEGDFVVSIMDA